MEKPNTSQMPAERRGPRREEGEEGDSNPTETWTKDTGCLSATFHTMWNGKPSKTWWKKKVRCPDEIEMINLDKIHLQGLILVCFFGPLPLLRAAVNLCGIQGEQCRLRSSMGSVWQHTFGRVPSYLSGPLMICTSAASWNATRNTHLHLRWPKPFCCPVWSRCCITNVTKPVVWDDERQNEMISSPQDARLKYVVVVTTCIKMSNTKRTQIIHCIYRPNHNLLKWVTATELGLA